MLLGVISMLDIKKIRENRDFVIEGLKKKNCNINIEELLDIDDKKRVLLKEVESHKAILNSVNKEIGLLKKNKQSADDKIEEMKDVSSKIKLLDSDILDLDKQISFMMERIPNVPHTSVPEGGENDFVEVRSFGEKRNFTFTPKTHWEIAEDLDIIDFKRGAKIAGSGFVVCKNDGVKLERALISFFLDTHIEKHGFCEVSVPYLVNQGAMFGTGQLPKMADDMYHLKEDNLYLIPTAEVPVTNLFANEIFEEKDLPKKYVAYSPCFRREAGSYGKDTRGMVRVHQFNKVEMVKWTKAEDSYESLEELVGYAENLLKALKLPYRVVNLAANDISFASAKTYDLEVWSAGLNRYLEVSSVSNFEDFQARRAKIRYKCSVEKKNKFVHTLNGSGLALPRVMISIIENYQNEDGSISIPDVLQPYMKGMTSIG